MNKVFQSNDFKNRIVYQIYPASFMDSNNDGWGDIRGIISKLDYLKDLGIGIIWLSPIYESPMDDMGYDISDYKKINHRFGTMEDFDDLIKEANKRDIRIVMDLVINHTSTEHEWFKKAIEPEQNKYRDYYIIEKGKGKNNKKVPNNWSSAFSGTCWKEIPSLKGMYYMHLFCDTQADLNYKNENVIKEIEEIIKFWLDKGVYGFRCDVINQIYKTTLKNDYSKLLFNKGQKYYCNQKGMFDVLKKIRNDVLNHYDTFLVGETSFLTPDIAREFLKTNTLDMFFEFDHIWCDKSKFIPILKTKFKAKKLAKPILNWQNQVDWIANYLENHDQLRSVSRYGDDKKYINESAKMLAIFLLSLKGTPFIYQGEEIGIKNFEQFSSKESDDISAKMVFKTAKSILHLKDETIDKMINETLNRDHARSPMQWNGNINGGFNQGSKTWLKVNPSYQQINVENQINDPNSILNFYKKLIKFRNDSEILKFGETETVKISNSIVSFKRIYNDKTYLIILNFSKKSKKYNKKCDASLLISNYDTFENGNLYPPYFGGIFEVK